MRRYTPEEVKYIVTVYKEEWEKTENSDYSSYCNPLNMFREKKVRTKNGITWKDMGRVALPLVETEMSYKVIRGIEWIYVGDYRYRVNWAFEDLFKNLLK